MTLSVPLSVYPSSSSPNKSKIFPIVDVTSRIIFGQITGADLNFESAARSFTLVHTNNAAVLLR